MQRDLAHLGVGQIEQAVGQADLIQHLQRGSVHGVSAEIAVEVAMQLEERDRHASTGQQQSQEHACGAGTDDAAAGFVAHGDRLCPDAGARNCRTARHTGDCGWARPGDGVIVAT